VIFSRRCLLDSPFQFFRCSCHPPFLHCKMGVYCFISQNCKSPSTLFYIFCSTENFLRPGIYSIRYSALDRFLKYRKVLTIETFVKKRDFSNFDFFNVSIFQNILNMLFIFCVSFFIFFLCFTTLFAFYFLLLFFSFFFSFLLFFVFLFFFSPLLFFNYSFVFYFLFLIYFIHLPFLFSFIFLSFFVLIYFLKKPLFQFFKRKSFFIFYRKLFLQEIITKNQTYSAKTEI